MKTTSLLTGVLTAVALVLLATATVEAGGYTSPMFAVSFEGKTVEGMVVARRDGETHLLGRDGRLWTIPDKKVTGSKKVADRFKPFSPSEMRARLLRELGSRFEVTGTRHYMVAHPRGQRDLWAQRFEQLYRRFVNYFSVRGFRLSEPPFPLIGIVCHNQQEFFKYSESTGIPVGRGVLGYYAYASNRIIVFDVKNDFGGDRWEWNNSTVVHEATHQVSYNTGLFNRLCPPPLWVSEGIATYFEAPGVFDSAKYPNRSDRINRVRFDDYRRLIAVPSRKKMAEQFPRALVLSDAPFRTATSASYAEAWAMTFYLIETRPHQYAHYLKRLNAHYPFEYVSAATRETDFTTIFGSSWPMFYSKFTRFMSEQ